MHWRKECSRTVLNSRRQLDRVRADAATDMMVPSAQPIANTDRENCISNEIIRIPSPEVQ